MQRNFSYVCVDNDPFAIYLRISYGRCSFIVWPVGYLWPIGTEFAFLAVGAHPMMLLFWNLYY